MPSGSGYLGGYGVGPRSAYATPAELAAKPWALDFVDGGGWPAFSLAQRFDPTRLPLEWATDDWDPGLRFWTLAFDPQLHEWLQDVNLGSAAVMAAREFARHHDRWSAATLVPAADGGMYRQPPDSAAGAAGPGPSPWIPGRDLSWRVDALAGDSQRAQAWQFINNELQDLADLMADDRARYLDEAWLQSDNIPLYFMHFLGMDAAGKPWTTELMRCALAIGNLVYMDYKAHFKRVRPSTLCPGLVPPWGPPRHPAFPSGHSFLGHFIALLLLEIEPLADRYGVFSDTGLRRGRKPTWDDYRNKDHDQDMRSPLLWLAWRLAKNRERIGVHYRSDSAASRMLAGALWQAVMVAGGPESLAMPTLQRVLERARSEWPAVMPGPQPAKPGGQASGSSRKSAA